MSQLPMQVGSWRFGDFNTIPNKRLLHRSWKPTVSEANYTHGLNPFSVNDNEASTEHYVESGVPLGPHLFLVLSKDLKWSTHINIYKQQSIPSI